MAVELQILMHCASNRMKPLQPLFHFRGTILVSCSAEVQVMDNAYTSKVRTGNWTGQSLSCGGVSKFEKPKLIIRIDTGATRHCTNLNSLMPSKNKCRNKWKVKTNCNWTAGTEDIRLKTFEGNWIGIEHRRKPNATHQVQTFDGIGITDTHTQSHKTRTYS